MNSSDPVQSGLLEHVTPDQVFNLPLYSLYIVIDTRPTSDFKAGSIASAHSFPPPPPEASEDAKDRALQSFFLYLCDWTPEHVDPILFVGDGVDGSESEAHLSWLVARFAAIQSRNLSLTTAHKPRENIVQGGVPLDEESYDPIRTFSARIIERTRRLWRLHGGYGAMEATFPSLCGHVSVDEMTPPPTLIFRHPLEQIPPARQPRVFMGSRVIPLNKAQLARLGISAVVMASGQQAEDLIAERDIACLSLNLRDSDDAHGVPACMAAAAGFISEQLLAGASVLVQLHGRSRSAAACIAWLMESQRMSFEEAKEYVMSRCRKVDATLLWSGNLQREAIGNSSSE